MKIIFLPSTRKDLLWMRGYYEAVFPNGASHAARQYQQTLNLIKANPFIGKRHEDFEDVREFLIPKTPFSITYRLTDEHIQILRIWDKRRDQAMFDLRD